MTSRTDYPFKAWILTPAYKPKEITFTSRYYCGGYIKREDTGGAVNRDEAFDTREECIAYGFRRLDEADARLEKQKAANAKKRATLEKSK